MATDIHQLRIRLGHRVRFKQAFPGNDTIPFVEQDAILTRVDEVNQIAYFTVGVRSIPVAWANVVLLEGGVGPPPDMSGSQGSGMGTDSS